jgi:hypothetical protein
MSSNSSRANGASKRCWDAFHATGRGVKQPESAGACKRHQLKLGPIPDTHCHSRVTVASDVRKRLGSAAADSIPDCRLVPTCQRCRRRLPETVERDLIGAWQPPRVRARRDRRDPLLLLPLLRVGDRGRRRKLFRRNLALGAAWPGAGADRRQTRAWPGDAVPQSRRPLRGWRREGHAHRRTPRAGSSHRCFRTSRFRSSTSTSPRPGRRWATRALANRSAEIFAAWWIALPCGAILPRGSRRLLAARDRPTESAPEGSATG